LNTICTDTSQAYSNIDTTATCCHRALEQLQIPQNVISSPLLSASNDLVVQHQCNSKHVSALCRTTLKNDCQTSLHLHNRRAEEITVAYHNITNETMHRN